MNTDENQILTSEPIILPSISLKGKDDRKGTITNSVNLISANKRFSLFNQFFNWQPTGVTIRLTLPIVNTDNAPLFGFRVTPFILSALRRANEFAGTNTYYNSAWVDNYVFTKFWHVPDFQYDPDNNTVSDIKPIGSGISIIESDNPPDMSYYMCSSYGWSGGLRYQIRNISNCTAQGKFLIARSYGTTLPFVPGVNPGLIRTPACGLGGSISDVAKNAFIYQDLAHVEDAEIHCPYVEQIPFQPIHDWHDVTYTQVCPPSSYVWFYIPTDLRSSGTANTISLQILIRADDDFRLHWVRPFAWSNIAPTGANFGADYRTPWIFGVDNNIAYTDKNTMTVTTPT